MARQRVVRLTVDVFTEKDVADYGQGWGVAVYVDGEHVTAEFGMPSRAEALRSLAPEIGDAIAEAASRRRGEEVPR